MIPSTEVNHANVSVNHASLQMGIDPSAFKHLMGVLTNLYSDKALAVVREYSTNAYDSQVQAGISRPIEVWLPSVQSRTPVFRVQDFGVGLSFDELRDVYAQYGASTKRGSNDVNGMLGLGCKSALTYATGFTITSVKNGRKVMAAISKDSEGLGAIKVLADLATDEPNGVTIEVPVDSNSIRKFRTTAHEFYRSWTPGTVLIDGDDPAKHSPIEAPVYFYRDFKDGDSSVWITKDILVVRNKDYGAKSYVVMGNVAYPHDFGISGCTIRAWVPIGGVDFVPAREALHYTDRTNNTVKSIKADFAALLSKRVIEVASKRTVFEKNDLLYQWSEQVSVLRAHRPRVTTDPRLTFLVSSGQHATRYKHSEVNWREFTTRSRSIVSGFPFKSVGPSHKRRLQEWFPGQGYLVFPPSTDLSAIEGHPRLVTWDEVVKTTTKPSPQKRQGTLYTAKKRGQHDWVAPKFIGSMVVYSTHGYSPLADDVWQVCLKMSQVERFRKLHPLSKSIDEYVSEQRKAASDALTEDEKLALSLKIGYPSPLRGPFHDPDFQKAAPLLDDPLLKRVTGLLTLQSPSMDRAANLGVTPTTGTKIVKEIQERYPLLTQYRNTKINVGDSFYRTDITQDLVVYLNSKYQALVAGKKA